MGLHHGTFSSVAPAQGTPIDPVSETKRTPLPAVAPPGRATYSALLGDSVACELAPTPDRNEGQTDTEQQAQVSACLLRC